MGGQKYPKPEICIRKTRARNIRILIIMGNSGIGPRYPNYPNNLKNNPIQICLFIAVAAQP